MVGLMRVEKRKRTDVFGIQREANRTVEDHKKGVEFDKSDIDWELTPENIHLKQTKNWNNAITRKLKPIESETGKKTRKDAVVLIDCVFTASPEFFEGKDKKQIKKYFEDCLNFYVKEYCQGDASRLLNAVIHFDEKTPHMQVASIPLLTSEVGTRLNAKVLMGGPSEYHKRQNRFFDEVTSHYGLERGDIVSATETKVHTTKSEWLIATLEEKIKSSEAVLEKKDSELKITEHKLKSAEENLHKIAEATEATDEKLKQKTDQVKQLSEISDNMRIKKATDIIRKDTVTVDKESYDTVVAATKAIDEKIDKINAVENLGEKIEELNKTNTELIKAKRERDSLKKEYDTMRGFIDDHRSTLDIRMENGNLNKELKTVKSENARLTGIIRAAEIVLKDIDVFISEHSKAVPEPIKKGIEKILRAFSTRNTTPEIEHEHGQEK